MQQLDIKELMSLCDQFDNGRALLKKQAFVPGAGAPPPQAPPVDPQTGMPIDPNTGQPMPPPQGGDPNAMPPGGGPPPPGGPGGPPPGDPNAMPPGGPGGPPPDGAGGPPPDGAGGPPPPDGGGGVPPEVEGALTDMAGGLNQLAQASEAQQQQTDQLSKRMMDIEQRMDDKEKEEKLNEAAPFEGSTKTQKDVATTGLTDGL